MVLYIILTIIVLILSIFYYFANRRYDYWKKKNVPYIQPLQVFGNYKDYILLKDYLAGVAKSICDKFPNEPYIGSFFGTEPALIVQDPELLKLILAKDYYYFSSREIANYTEKEVITQNLFFTYGDRWKILRQNLTPLFTSAKMKNMFHLIQTCGDQIPAMIEREKNISDNLEVRSLMARYTMDAVCACAFGVDAKAMTEGSNSPFKKMGDIIFSPTFSRAFRTVARAIWPAIFYGLGFQSFPDELSDFFKNLLVGVFKARNYEPTNRNDFVDLVLSLKKNEFIIGDSLSNLKTGGTEKCQLPADDALLVSNCIVFFAAGFETSSSTLSFTLYELAKNKEVQDRVIAEVDAYLMNHGDKVEYDCVSSVQYLEACVDEVLRLYPVLGILTREVVEDYTLPTGLCLEKGLRIHIPIFQLHKNEEHFPEPEVFKPERFLPEEKHNIRPYTYMPFGEGPRICIGMRFAKMQILACLVKVFQNYKVELAENMPLTLELHSRSMVTQPKQDIYLKFIPRK